MPLLSRLITLSLPELLIYLSLGSLIYLLLHAYVLLSIAIYYIQSDILGNMESFQRLTFLFLIIFNSSTWSINFFLANCSSFDAQVFGFSPMSLESVQVKIIYSIFGPHSGSIIKKSFYR